MMHRERKHQAMAGLVAALFFVGIGRMALANEGPDPAEEDRSKLAMMLDLLRSDDVRITFFGKVIDQGGAPVSDAKVELDVSRSSDDEHSLFGGTKTMGLVTDENGLFNIKGERGSGVFIQNIGKLGYDSYGRLNGEVSFNYGSEEDGPIHVPNKESPVVFVLRRMGEGTFCINNDQVWFEINHRTHEYSSGYDFIQRVDVYDSRKTSVNGNPLVCDLLVTARYETNSGAWTLTFSSQSTNGGIYWTDQRLYEAPEAEYRPEYTYYADRQSTFSNRYMYIKSRDPAIYTRLELDDINFDTDLIIIDSKEAVTNPYGDRNFELHSELSWEMITHLTAEVENAFRVGKRPVKPDIKAMIEAARGER